MHFQQKTSKIIVVLSNLYDWRTKTTFFLFADKAKKRFSLKVCNSQAEEKVNGKEGKGFDFVSYFRGINVSKILKTVLKS